MRTHFIARWIFILLAAQGVVHAGENRAPETPGSGFAAAVGAATAEGAARATKLQPREHGLWAGEWLMAGSDLEENVYSILRIRDVDAGGFSYETECRDIPYGPNAVRSGEERARFQGPLEAWHPETGTYFRLSIHPDDRHDRTLEMEPVQCSHADTPGNLFVFRRSVFRAGFDCDRAATDVEHAICGNELIALGDFEMGTLYRELLDRLPDNAAQGLRVGQRAWLRQRDRGCRSKEGVDAVCIARLYADRLAALARLAEPRLGAGPRFDAAYALARIIGGEDLRRDTAARLAMYPLAMNPAGPVAWRADQDGLLLEQVYVKTRIVWPADVDFRYSDMLYVAFDGTVWTVEHTETAEPLHPDSGIRPDRLWLGAGRAPLTIRTEAEPGAPHPPPVARWLEERRVDVDSSR